MTNLAPVSVRISARERALLAAAAEQSRTSLSDFIRRKAVEAAEIELVHQNRVIIPTADWERFEAWANSPAREVPALRELAQTVPVWRD